MAKGDDIQERLIEKNSILMVGIGGYGYYYLKTLLEEFPPGSIRLCGAVDPYAEKSELLMELERRKVPIYREIDDFYSGGNTADLAVISSPIHYHVPQSIKALQNGSHVLCDKPLAVTVQEAKDLIKVRNSSGNWVQIGYQWSYTTAIQALKKDIMEGQFGRPKRLKTLCFWPRGWDYYRRNDWAGKKRDNSGQWILDSPANNAMAHFLHNLFYLLGDEIYLSAQPKEVTAELYRAYPIENFDSAACRIFTKENTELLFYASHAAYEDKGPMFNLEFEDAEISYGEVSDVIVAKRYKGREKKYGSPGKDHQFLKLLAAVEMLNNPKEMVCGPEAAFPQTLCMNGIQESVPEIPFFPKSLVQEDETRDRLRVKGLDEAFYQSYRAGLLPFERNISWATRGKTIDLVDYHYFPGGNPASASR